MKHFRLFLTVAVAAISLPSPTHAADPTPAVGASLNLRQKDIEYVSLNLEPGARPEVRVYIAKGKLGDFLSITEANLNKPISIFLDGKLITAPVITKPFIEKIRFLTLKFPDFNSASQVAHLFFPAM